MSLNTVVSGVRAKWPAILFTKPAFAGNPFSLKANIGNNITNSESNALSVRGEKLVIPGLYNASNITGNAVPSDFKSKERSYSYFANVDLGYKDYLFLNLTGRKDWTSVIKNPFFYYSGGVSFIPTKAFPGFGGNILTFAKVSASYVKVGNAIVGPYDINDRFVTATSVGFPYATINSFGQTLAIAEGWHRGPRCAPVADPTQLGAIVDELLAGARANAGMDGEDGHWPQNAK